jgi:hypothetical protein
MPLRRRSDLGDPVDVAKNFGFVGTSRATRLRSREANQQHRTAPECAPPTPGDKSRGPWFICTLEWLIARVPERMVANDRAGDWVVSGIASPTGSGCGAVRNSLLFSPVFGLCLALSDMGG